MDWKKSYFWGLIILVCLVVILFFIIHNSRRIFIDRFEKNINEVEHSCILECSSGDANDFCNIHRVVKDGINDKFEATCYELATKDAYSDRNYEIDECVQINCSSWV